MASLRVLAIAVIGRHNQPLFVQGYTESERKDPDLKWHYAAHMSLDMFDERDASTVRPSDGYLGLLYTMDDYAVYGFQTITRIRFVLVLAIADFVVRDLDVKALFRAIHTAYVAYVCNPFSGVSTDNPNALATPIRSKQFATKMSSIASAHSAEPP